MEYREKVVCVMTINGRFAFAIRHDSNKNRDFLTPPGGGLEPGETPEIAVRREMGEEMQMPAIRPVYLGVLENEFEWRQKARHEKVFCFLHQCSDQNELPPNAVDTSGDVLPIVLMSLQQLRENHLPVFPNGILDFLQP
jgi:ADP-ribose pyrophosphatase YjhB (NUDIX family)